MTTGHAHAAGPEAGTTALPETQALASDSDAAARIREAIGLAPAPLCLRCVGRFAGRLDRGALNPDKGRILVEALACTVTERPHECPWCEGVFTEIDHLVELAENVLAAYEFKTLLLATKVHPDIQDLEARLFAPLGPLADEAAEPMKTELNREIGKVLLPRVGAEVDFDRADAVVLIDPFYDTVDVTPSNLFLYGRYRKFDRTIPQTKWPCRTCQGKGCTRCAGTGQQYETSVEQCVAEVALRAFDAADGSFHGSGREDIDALMLGTGRPFVLELKQPRWRLPRSTPADRAPQKDDPVLDWSSLEAAINAHARPRVEIEGLRLSERSEVVEIKEAALDKAYRAHVVAEGPVHRTDLEEAIGRIVAAPLEQRTPERVAHRRADKVRKRQVRSVTIAAFGSHLRAPFEALPEEKDQQAAFGPDDIGTDQATRFTLDILAESGTYIKELVHGDDGRTQPSFTGLLQVPLKVEYLDVVAVGSDPREKGQS